MKKLFVLIWIVLSEIAVRAGSRLNYLSTDDSTAIITALGHGIAGE